MIRWLQNSIILAQQPRYASLDRHSVSKWPRQFCSDTISRVIASHDIESCFGLQASHFPEYTKQQKSKRKIFIPEGPVKCQEYPQRKPKIRFIQGARPPTLCREPLPTRSTNHFPYSFQSQLVTSWSYLEEFFT